MQTKPTLSNNKIIIFVVFVCAAIMASLFVFHMRNKPVRTQLADDAGVMFPVARDIKAFDLTASNGNKLSLNDFRQHWTLLFFGFTHCSNICPTTLALLNRVYTQLHNKHPNLQVVFISLDPQRDNLATLAKYTRTFNPAFISASGTAQELRKLQSQLGIYSATDDATKMQANYQLQHTSSILLINPKGKWAGLFKYGLTPKKLTRAVEESIKLLS